VESATDGYNTSEEYSSEPVVSKNRKEKSGKGIRHRTVYIVSDDDDEMRQSQSSRKRTKQKEIASITPSTSGEESQDNLEKRDKAGNNKKARKTTEISEEELSRMKEGKGKGVAPPTTGEYVEKAMALKAMNDKKQMEIQLELEARCFSMEEMTHILRKAHLDPENKAEEAAMTPTADLVSRIREAHNRKTQPPRAVEGPASRTRVKTRVTTEAAVGIPRAQPLPAPKRGQIIEDPAG